MTTIYIYAFISVIAVSIISFVGAFSLSLKEEIVKKYINLFISLAVGALLGDAFIHLIPEIFENSFSTPLMSLLIIAGIILFFIVEKFLHWHHHGEDKEETHIHPVGKLLLFTDGFHNFIDGIIIGVSFLISIPVGIATTLAVILHEIPQEIGDFAVLIHSGYEKKKALWLNFLSALTSVLGLIVAIIFGSMAETFTVWVLPIAAGGFIYIAVADLIPELHKTKEAKYSVLQILSVLLGVLIMVSLVLLE
ncbi:ZIP family metal transporter [Candidatus Nomurabacteria bacterium CG_4_9_14_0_2_um_filter_32_10]|uniref:ZIP family metal transporter n=3 Tax=Candidatus Nomuraibacteriota TaxID=1752729 RepID=A0A2H0CG22_9BACT|nr:MAG: ZIP family metal transporter [Candidatus Nomurabacteria bacterium CG22_combo_CG10-13_8_21_14_all_32_8]PIZ85767.1 MAG: ZIP family metal transporter [Candidatus Nomurabacteria bacterium CG_4_10_14_0_2_um_filter_33_9]PJC49621.1 MAG: ZIP family metal transporter [Candidatus Nomurabacteria bacterium CG_4_9_14_0_2_um_filter_32_10]